MKKTVKDFDLNGKKVIIRCDFNVPIESGKIMDDNRIKESLKTIRYVRKNGGKVILLSHLGRIEKPSDKQKYTLKPVAQRLSELLHKKVTFIDTEDKEEIKKIIKSMKDKDVVMLENTRFEDLDDKKESGADKELGKFWASLGDIFINDAFGTLHRRHASNYEIAKNIPSGIGFLIQKEIKNLDKLITNPKKPYIIVLGGAKVSDKIGLISNLITKADYILIGGGMAFTFIKAAGFNIGSSLLEKDALSYCANLLEKYPDKIVLPIDIITAKNLNDKKPKERFLGEIEDDEIGLDIGPKTVKIFSNYLKGSKTIFWNGPLGYFEKKEFSNGTKQIAKTISENKGTTIIGGGDTARAVIEMGFKDKMKHSSTGGGASLEYLENPKLKSLEVIDEK